MTNEIGTVVSSATGRLVEALLSLGVEAEIMDNPFYRSPTGMVVEAMTKRFPSDITEFTALAQYVSDLVSEVFTASPKFWIYDIDASRHLVRFGVEVEGVNHATRLVSDHITGAELPPVQRIERSMVQFVNESDNEFTDISSERTRTYNFGSKGFVKITNPLYLSVSASGGHRIFSADGQSHYVPAGWLHLSWTVKEGSPNFVK